MLTIAQREQLAKFAGLECRCKYNFTNPREEIRYWGSCPMHSQGGHPPEYDRDEVAISLLPVLKNEFTVELYGHNFGWDCSLHRLGKIGDCTGSENEPTIATSITSAVLALLEEEKQ